MQSKHHLKLRGGRWHLKLAIPRGLRHLYPNGKGNPSSHIEEALGTRDLAEANRRKYPRITYWLADFDAQRRGASGTLPPDMASARDWRERLRAATTEEEAEVVRDLAGDWAQGIAESGGETAEGGETLEGVARAVEAFRLATAKVTLREAWEKWRAEWRITEAARLKYEQAFREFMEFMRVADARPESVTNAKAREYVRWLNTEAKSARGGALSKSSKEGRLSPLRSFWRDYLIHNEVVEGNPWMGHKIIGERTNAKRPYTHDEILALLNGPERAARKDVRYTKRTIIELYALGFFTGARREEIAGRLIGDFEKIKGGYIMHIRKSKTAAGERAIPIYHPIPVSVIKARVGKRTNPKAQLFEEFERGGPDGTLGDNVGKAMGHYRDAAGIGPEADFHSTRRQLITELVAKGHSKELVQFYVGHKVPGVTGIYAKPTDEGMRKIARGIHYPPKIERAFVIALG